MTDTIDQAVEVLNRALAADPGGLTSMFTTYSPINETLAHEPAIQAYWDGDIPDRPGCYLGPLGLINGLFGTGACGMATSCPFWTVTSPAADTGRHRPRADREV